MPAAVSGSVWPEHLDRLGDPQPVALAAQRGVAAELRRRAARRTASPSRRSRSTGTCCHRPGQHAGQRHVHAVQGDVGPGARGLAELARRSARCGRRRSGPATAWVRNGKPAMSTVGRAVQAALRGELLGHLVLGDAHRRPGRRRRRGRQQQQDDDAAARASVRARSAGRGPPAPHAASGSTPWISGSAQTGGGCSPSGGSAASASTTT